jgi:hypothetical protein
MFDELRTKEEEMMRIEAAQRELQGRRASGSASGRRADALVAAYIHELSPRHRAEREATKPEAGAAEARA